MASSAADILARFKHDLGADKKKTAILSSLLLVFIVVVVIQFMPKPDEAGAQPEDILPKAAARPAKKTPEQQSLVRPEPQAVAAASETPEHSERPIVAPLRYVPGPAQETTPSQDAKAVSVAGMGRSLERNLFNTPDWSLFPLDKPVVIAPIANAENAGIATVIGQLREAMAERREQRRKEKQAILAELDALQLQSTMTGTHSLAYISGLLVHTGSSIHGFSVVAIEEKAVKLEKRGHTFELKLP